MTVHLILAAIITMTPGQYAERIHEADSKVSRIVPAAEAVVSRLEEKSRVPRSDRNAEAPGRMRAASKAGTSDGSNGTAIRRVGKDGKKFAGQSLSTKPDRAAAAPASCAQRYDYDPADFTRVLENFDQTSPLLLDGPEWDNTLVRNCRIHDTVGIGILIGNVRNVVIHNCEVWNVDKGIMVGATGSTEDVTIDGNYVHDVQRSGIGSLQGSADGFHQKNVRILHNRIKNTGIGRPDGHAHPIYIQTQDYLIEGNVISGTRDGNGISIRSSGIVRCNRVSGVSSTGKPALRYYSDHETGPSNTLLIEHNQLISDDMGIDIKSPTDQRRGPKAVKLLHRAWIRVRMAINRAFDTIGLDVPFPHRNRHVVKNFIIRYNTISAPTPISIAPEYGTAPYSVNVHDNRILLPSSKGVVQDSQQ